MVKLSIITVNYNSSTELEKTIKNIALIKNSEIEYIVIDGASTDSSISIVNKYESYIDQFITEKDEGVYDAMNKGASLANGEYLVFINAGDLIYYLDLPSIIDTSTAYCYIQDESKVKRERLSRSYLCRNMPCHQSVFYKTSNFIPFSLDAGLVADFEQMVKLTTKVTKYHFNNCLVFYATAGLSNEIDKYTLKNKCNFLKNRILIIRRELGLFWGLWSFIHSVRILIVAGLKRND